MSKLSNNYPAMDPESCDAQGLAGNCGRNCRAYIAGKCPCESDITRDWANEVIENAKILINKFNSKSS